MEDQMHQCSPAMEQYVRDTEHAWNSGDFDAIVLTNTIDCHWRNRVTFLWGREQIRAFIARQIRREIDARILIEPWAEGMRRLALRFAREFRDDSGIWFRAYGSEDLEFDDAGLVKRRLTAANEHPIQEHERVLRWPAGSRPADHPSLSELGF
jgi:nuclear transport factor 2 (NTF2) superfamily protein